MVARLRLRKVVRVAVIVAVGCLVVLVGLAVVRTLMQGSPSKATAQRLTIVQVIAGVLSATAAILGTVLAVRQSRPSGKRQSDMMVPKLLPHDRLVNRSPEMHELVGLLRASQVVGCYGPRGAGKSFLLEHLTDIVNGNRAPSPGQPKPQSMTAALYFDLADAVGFPEAQAQICRSVLGHADSTWEDFVLFVQRSFKRRRVLLVLDNVNSEGLWRQLGEAAYSYCVLRPNDRVVFGSIDKVVLSNLAVKHLEVAGLDLEAATELVTMSGTSISRQELVKLHDDSRGLPLYLRLLAARETRSGVLDEELIPDLSPDTRQLLAYMSLIALVDRRISISELRRCPIVNLEEQLAIAENRTRISSVPAHRERRFKIHDVVRDAALRRLQPEVESAALFLFERALGQGKLERAALFSMFADPEQIDQGRLDDLLRRVVGDAIKTKNYALLGSLHGRASENARMLRFLSADETRGDLLCFARASELAGLGRYTEAEDELLSSSIVRTRWRQGAEATDLQADLRFLQADIAHLLNRYDEAALMFEELGIWAVAHERPSLEALCVWGHGHVLRHQGRDLDRALELFDRAAGLATTPADLFARAHSICNANGVKILMNAVPDDQEEQLAAVEDEIATGSHHGYLLEVWKTQAQLAWWRGRGHQAGAIVDAAIEHALELNDRLLYNLYFERGEFQRLGGEPVAALADYRAVLAFGEGNRDRNLVTNALLGLVLSEIACGRWLHHGSAHAARASVLRARQVALDADIRISVRTAELVTGMLDDPALPSDGVRLFLL